MPDITPLHWLFAFGGFAFGSVFSVVIFLAGESRSNDITITDPDFYDSEEYRP